MLAFPSHLPVFGCLFGDLVGICGIMHHIKVLTCRIDTTECLFSWSLVTNYVILVLLYDRHGVSGSNMLDWDGALARNDAGLGWWLRESLAAQSILGFLCPKAMVLLVSCVLRVLLKTYKSAGFYIYQSRESATFSHCHWGLA
jgi:hypothetical protein